MRIVATGGSAHVEDRPKTPANSQGERRLLLQSEKLESEKRDDRRRLLLLDQLLVGRLPAGARENRIPVRDDLVSIPPLPVLTPQRGEISFVVHRASLHAIRFLRKHAPRS